MTTAATDFTIRPVLASEYDVLGEITVHAYVRDGFLRGPRDPYAEYLRDVASRAEAGEVLVAVAGSGLLGGVALVPPGSPAAELAGPADAEIRALAVAPDARGRGVGTALAGACVERARARGGARVVLCSQRQMLAAHRIYERLGFQRAPELDWRPLPEVTLWGYTLDFSGGREVLDESAVVAEGLVDL